MQNHTFSKQNVNLGPLSSTASGKCFVTLSVFTCRHVEILLESYAPDIVVTLHEVPETTLLPHQLCRGWTAIVVHPETALFNQFRG